MPEGFQFQCQPGCTACCEQKGFVYLTEADVVRVSAYLEITPQEFERKYVYRTKNRIRLRVPRETQCNFLREGGCSIHAVKPTQCRLFPFWPEMVDSKQEWRHTATYCPGIGQGPLVQIEDAQTQAREMRAAYPEIY